MRSEGEIFDELASLCISCGYNAKAAVVGAALFPQSSDVLYARFPRQGRRSLDGADANTWYPTIGHVFVLDGGNGKSA